MASSPPPPPPPHQQQEQQQQHERHPRNSLKRLASTFIQPGKAKDRTGPPPSRGTLRASAGYWRRLACLGISLNSMASPRPPSPDFTRMIPSVISEKKDMFALEFYVPEGYDKGDKDISWPVVVNFHGGGFTLGSPSDDARFARFVLEKSKAVFVSVGYRLAPEAPFPTAVNNGADAILHLVNNAEELRIDVNRIATSGFSAGGNIAITAPLRLSQMRKIGLTVPDYHIIAIAAWYPITDYTLTRAQRRETAISPKACASPTLTNLFDAAYLFPPTVDRADPCLSPSKAPDELLIEGLPNTMLIYTCEFDMLLREGEDFAKRLEKPPISKRVHYTMIKGVLHGWDKTPNPLKPPKKTEKLYTECGRRLGQIFQANFEASHSRSRIRELWKSTSSLHARVPPNR